MLIAFGSKEHTKGMSTVASIQSPPRQPPMPQVATAHSPPLLVLCLVGSRLLDLRCTSPQSWQIEVYFEPFLSSGQALRAIPMRGWGHPPSLISLSGQFHLTTFPSQL